MKGSMNPRKLAEIRRKANESKKRNKARSGNKGTFKKPITVGGTKFWSPIEQSLWTAENAEYLVRLLPAVQTHHFHGINKANGDTEVLPRLLRKYPQYQDYVCHYSTGEELNLKPKSNRWMEVSEESLHAAEDSSGAIRGEFLTHPDVDDVEVSYFECLDPESGELHYIVIVPQIHPYKRQIEESLMDLGIQNATTYDDGTCFVTVLTEEDAVWAAQVVLHQATSCVACCEQQYEYSEGIDRDDRVVKGGQPTENILIPLYQVEFGKLEEPNRPKSGKKDPVGRITKRDRPVWKGLREPSIRLGFGVIQAPLNPNWSAFATYMNWATYVKELGKTCTSCLKDGRVTSSDAHNITIKSMKCPDCGEHWVVNVVEGDESYECTLNEATVAGMGGYDAVYEYSLDAGTCGSCGYQGLPKVDLSCSSCDNPTPLNPSEVITKASVRSGSGKYFVFEKYTDPSNDFRFHYPDKFWDDLPVVSEGVSEFSDLPYGAETVGEACRKALEPQKEGKEERDLTNMDGYPRLTNEQFARLIDAQALPLQNSKSE